MTKNAQDFEDFWRIYPKKRGKFKAEAAWKKLKPTKELTLKIMNAVREQANWEDWQKDRGQFIPHPATWLNQGRWEDEAEITVDPAITKMIEQLKKEGKGYCPGSGETPAWKLRQMAIERLR